MKKTTRVVDEKRGIMQVTTLDERWYPVPSKDPITKLPIYEYYPSSSWIAAYYPKGKGFEIWLKKNGEDSDEMMLDAGERGSKVHHAIERIIAGETIKMDDKVFNGQTGQEEELTVDEWEIVKSFVDWNNEVKPEYLLSEKTVISKKYKYGGTLDCVAKIAGEMYLIDFKTSKEIYTSHRIQVSSYKHALAEEESVYGSVKLAILQVGFGKNRKHWKFTEVEDKFPLFLTVYDIWKEENGDAKPKQKDLPVEFSITNPLKQRNESRKK